MKRLSTLCFTSALIIGLSSSAFANPLYCASGSAYIDIGASESDVTQACGAPANIKKAKQTVMQKVPVTQLTFNVATAVSGTYGGTPTPGIQSGAIEINTGELINVVVTVENNLITTISLNGTNAQSVSICSEGSFEVGDSGSDAVDSCGDPASVNNTYRNENTNQSEVVETWSYTPGNYQQPFQLTFVNGSLTQINQ